MTSLQPAHLHPPAHDEPLDLDAILVPGARLSFKGYGAIDGKNYPSSAPWSQFCEEFGFVLSERVTKTKTDALITDEPDSEIGKEAQARVYGTPIIPMDVFTQWVETSLIHQPAHQPEHQLAEATTEILAETAETLAEPAEEVNRPAVGQEPPETTNPTAQPLPENPYSRQPSTEHRPPMAPVGLPANLPRTAPGRSPLDPNLSSPPVQKIKKRSWVWFVVAALMFVLALLLVIMGMNAKLRGYEDGAGLALISGFAAVGSGITLTVVGLISLVRK